MGKRITIFGNECSVTDDTYTLVHTISSLEGGVRYSIGELRKEVERLTKVLGLAVEAILWHGPTKDIDMGVMKQINAALDGIIGGEESGGDKQEAESESQS